MRMRRHVVRTLTACTLGACGMVAPAAGTPAGADVRCPDGHRRIAASCDSASQLKARVFSANAGLPTIGLGLSAAYEQQAIRQVSTATQQLALELDAKCAQYNACAIDAATWLASEERLRRHARLVESLTATASPSAAVGDAIWENALPALASARLTLAVRVQQQTGPDTFLAHASGAPLPSGAALRFALRSSRPAYVYVLLLSSQGRGEQLFPRAGMAPANPIPAGREIAMPPTGAGSFVLDDHPGIEHLQIIASTRPLTDLEGRLDALSAARGDGTTTGVLRTIGALLCAPLRTSATESELGVSSVSCRNRRTRGLVFTPATSASEASSATTTLHAEPGDELVVLQHEIDHVARAPRTGR